MKLSASGIKEESQLGKKSKRDGDLNRIVVKRSE